MVQLAKRIPLLCLPLIWVYFNYQHAQHVNSPVRFENAALRVASEFGSRISNCFSMRNGCVWELFALVLTQGLCDEIYLITCLNFACNDLID